MAPKPASLSRLTKTTNIPHKTAAIATKKGASCLLINFFENLLS
jgi:hypothetical protein